MSRGTAATVGDVLRVLIVGDTGPVDAAMDALSTRFDSVSLFRERRLSSALERLDEVEVHCVVCAFDGADGESTVERIRERNGVLPIVAVTDGTAADRALESGATDVVGADDSPSVVAARVRTAAERERYRIGSGSSTSRYRSLLESSDALVWVLDEGGNIAYASPAVERRLGFTPDELDRRRPTRFVHPDDRDDARETFETVATGPFGATDRATLRLRHADGTWRVADLHAVNRLDDPLIEGVVLTITPQPPDEQGADDLRDAIDRLEAALFTVGPRWELRHANDAAIRLFDGDDPRAGTVVWDLVPDAVRETFYERFHEAATTGSVVTFETTYPSLESRLEVAVHPSDTGVTVYARETAAESAPTVDRERFDRLESVVDALDDGVAVLEGTTIRRTNAALLELADAETLVGRELDALFDDELAAAIRERADSPVVRWMEPITGTLATARDRPVDVFVTPIPDHDRTVCVVRDRRRSPVASLSTLERTVSKLRDAEAQPALREAIVDATLELTDADLAGWYVVDDDRLRPATFATPESTPSIAPPPVDRTESPLGDVLESETAAVHEWASFEPFLTRAGIRAERVLTVPVGGDGLLLAASTDPMAFETAALEAVETLTELAAIALEGLEHESRADTRRRELAALESTLDRFEQLRSIERELLDEETRENIERRLCEALTSLDVAEGSIELAWIGDVAVGSETVSPRCWAGRDGAFLESLSIPLDEAVGDPAGRTAATRETTLVEDLAQDGRDETRGEWQRLALERGFRSAVSVPLTSGEFLYGTLTAYADRPAVFDDRTRHTFEHLAAVAGYAIGAVETRRALLTDGVTELELVLREETEPLATVAGELGRRIDVRTVVPRSSGGSTVFCTVADVAEGAIAAAVDSLESIETVRTIDDGTEGLVVELVLTEPTIAETIAEHGGRVRSVAPAEDRTRLVLELSSTVDVRSFVQALERTYPGVDMVARRERDQSARSARAFDAELRDRLSERQFRTLETAYYGGFFEWPRESTGEDVADSLGVSQPTFSRHLRIAQRKLFALLFDERNGGE